jgi:hypothetical protein
MDKRSNLFFSPPRARKEKKFYVIESELLSKKKKLFFLIHPSVPNEQSGTFEKTSAQKEKVRRTERQTEGEREKKK